MQKPPTLREQQLRILWDILPRPDKDSVVRLMARDHGKINGDYARTFGEMCFFVTANEGSNVYVAPNPTASVEGTRHSAADVTHWSWLLIDFDPVCRCNEIAVLEGEEGARKCITCQGLAQPMAAARRGLDLLTMWLGVAMEGMPMAVIDSGRGAQVWLRLDDWPLTDSGDALGLDETIDRKSARKVTGYWLKRLDEFLGYHEGCRVDTSTSDLPRVMRCPGTVNQKTGRPACFIRASGERSGLTMRLIDGVPPAAMVEPSVAGIAAGQRWQMVFPHLTRTAQQYLMRGQQEPGRHKVLWHTAKKFAELGVERAEAHRALARANGLMGEDEALDADQIGLALDGAYGR